MGLLDYFLDKPSESNGFNTLLDVDELISQQHIIDGIARQVSMDFDEAWYKGGKPENVETAKEAIFFSINVYVDKVFDVRSVLQNSPEFDREGAKQAAKAEAEQALAQSGEY